MKKIDKPIYIRLGKQLKEARLRKGYSLAEVAEMVGRSKVSIKRYEDATVRIDMDTLNKLSSILDMQVMDVSATIDGKEFGRQLELYPKLEVLLPEDRELQEANEYFTKFADKVMDKFVHSDISLQKSILIMLKFSDDEVADVMKFLH